MRSSRGVRKLWNLLIKREQDSKVLVVRAKLIRFSPNLVVLRCDLQASGSGEMHMVLVVVGPGLSPHMS